MKHLVVGVPLALVVILWVLEVNYALRLSITVLLVALLALFNSFRVFVWIMKKNTGSVEMQEIAQYIMEGSEGYFAAQYGTIKFLSGGVAILIMTIYYFRAQAEVNPILSPL